MLDLKQMGSGSAESGQCTNHRTRWNSRRSIYQRKCEVWIRYVVVPGWSDDDDSARAGRDLPAIWSNVEKREIRGCCPIMSWANAK